MKRFIEGECRTQTTLMPGSLDDYVSETNPVRIVDVFVDELDLFKLAIYAHPLEKVKLVILSYFKSALRNYMPPP